MTRHPALARLGRHTRTVLAFAVLAGAARVQVCAAQAPLLVSATIQRHASIQLAPPASITISEADVARGYIQLDTPLQVTVRSNAPQGYTLVFETHQGPVQRTVVEGLATTIVADSGAATAVRPAAGPGVWRDVVHLRFRFELARGARPGTVPWPVQISMMSQ